MKIIVHVIINTILGQLSSIFGLLIIVTLIKNIGSDGPGMREYVLLTSLAGIYGSIANTYLLTGSGVSIIKLKILRIIVWPYLLLTIFYLMPLKVDSFKIYILCFLLILSIVITQEFSYINSALIKKSKWYKANVNYLIASFLMYMAVLISPGIDGLIGGSLASIIIVTILTFINRKEMGVCNENKKEKINLKGIINSSEIFVVYYIELILINFLAPDLLPEYSLLVKVIFALATLSSYGLISVSSKFDRKWIEENLIKIYILSTAANLIILLVGVKMGYLLGLLNENFYFLANVETICMCSLYGSTIGARAIIIKYYESNSGLGYYSIIGFFMAVVIYYAKIESNHILMLLMCLGIVYHGAKAISRIRSIDGIF